MEQDQQAIQQPVATPPQEHVGFPAPSTESSDKKSGFIKWIIAGVGVVAIIIIGVFFVMRSPSDDSSNDTNDSADAGGDVLSTFPTLESAETPQPTATPTPKPVDKAEIKIEILNGTGTPGDAGFVSKELVAIDFDADNIEAANADDQEETTTTITYSRELPQSLIDEIVEALTTSFGKIKTRKGTVSGDFDIRILTGPKEGEKMEKETATPEPTDEPSEE